MKTIADLKQMMKEPASKEWFAKHGKPKSEALRGASGKIILKKPRMLTEAERKEKTKDWPKHHEVTEKEKTDYQHRTGRGYHE